jgi:hypothetical protein
MENVQSASLFNLSIDPVTKEHLSETARWARFLAIVGFIFLGLMIIGGIAVVSYMANTVDSYNTGINMFAGVGVGMIFFYLLVAAIWFFPLLFLFRFATRMKAALEGNDQQALNTSLQNLKVCFRYVGVVTIVGLAFYALFIIFAIIGATAALS